MKTILVTGGAGFIGSNLCDRLLGLGYRIINLDNFNSYYNSCIKRINIINSQLNENYYLVQGDIRNNEILNYVFTRFNIDIVIHLAALAGVRNSLQNPQEYMDVDVKGTVNILECCVKYNVSKMIFASSSSVYGKLDVPFHEFDNINTQESPYAAAKAAGELLCRVYNNVYGLPAVCLRFFTVYGPRQRPEMAIHKFTRLIDEGTEIEIYGDGTSSRDYTYIDDIIDGIVSVINLDCKFEIFNLGNSHAIKINCLIDIIEEKLKKKAIRRYVDNQNGDVFNTWADTSKAYILLNYKPSINIDEGIGRFVDWYRAYKKIYEIK